MVGEEGLEPTRIAPLDPEYKLFGHYRGRDTVGKYLRFLKGACLGLASCPDSSNLCQEPQVEDLKYKKFRTFLQVISTWFTD